MSAARGFVTPLALFGVEALVRPLLGSAPHVVHHADEVVLMDDSATSPLREKPQSSIRLGMEALARGEVSAFVTCGHSGAAMAAAVHCLGRFEGVHRPALVSALPRADGGALVVLDLGASVDCRPDQLATFARLGEAYARCALGIPAPRVGLLSNGEERSKGNAQVKAALPLLDALPIRFFGPVEPHDAFAGAVDVLVCDGFVGNVLLKTAEAMSRLGERPRRQAHGGGILLGVRGVVVIGHGRATPDDIRAAVSLAEKVAASALIPTLRAAFEPSG
jgi:glycerol-3-phosphate acyltransferase PlsX